MFIIDYKKIKIIIINKAKHRDESQHLYNLYQKMYIVISYRNTCYNKF